MEVELHKAQGKPCTEDREVHILNLNLPSCKLPLASVRSYSEMGEGASGVFFVLWLNAWHGYNRLISGSDII